MKISTQEFGLGSTLIRLENSKGQYLAVSNFGARGVDLYAGGKHILLGFDSAEEYVEKDIYPGATIGRVAGRIKDAQAEISGKTYQFDANEGKNTLHGGDFGPEGRLWTFEVLGDEGREDEAAVRFELTSNDGENGFPGQLKMIVTHSFNESGEWKIDYKAISTKDTLYNPTGHAYFNLTGEVDQTIDQHSLELAASRIVALRDGGLIRGDILDLAGTELDFTNPKKIGTVLHSDHEQVKLATGIDHPFLLDQVDLEQVQARLELGQLALEVRTDQPAIVIFTANFGDKNIVFHGKEQVHHAGLTFECQVSPGSLQLPELGNILLKAGEEYTQTTIYKVIEK